MAIRAKIETKSDKIAIWFFGDSHLGHEDFDNNKYVKYLKWLRGGEDRYMIGMGDYIEAAIPTHMPQTIFTQEVNPDDQIDWITDTLREHAESGKILAMIEGNHEDRIYNKTSFRPLKMLTTALGIPKTDLGSGGYFRLQVNDKTFTFCLLHGYGTSQTPEFHLRKAIGGGYCDDADILAIGHIHRLFENTYERARLTDNDKEYLHKILGVRTGGFLKSPEYARKRLMPMISTGSPILMLYPKTGAISINISDFIGISK